MSWSGKIIGGVFGMMLGGPLGALIGAAVGHNFDKGVEQAGGRRPTGSRGRTQHREESQMAFYTAAFSVMGHLCKADGQVSQDEIKLARRVMLEMDMDSQLQQVAITLFKQGKANDFPLQAVIGQFKKVVGYQPNLYRMFLEIQIMAAYADDVMHPEERRLLEKICDLLGMSRQDLDHLCIMISNHFARGTQSGKTTSLAEAYTLLGVEKDAPEAEVKRAYRKLISRHHPDKLASKGLPEEMMKVATQRTHEIRQAYEQIKKARGF